MRKCFLYAPWMGLMLGLAGCHHPSVTAVSLDADACGPECCSFWGVLHHCVKQKEDGIPFYLPKPLLIVAKNFRNIEEAKVGLTDSAPIPTYFDDQAKYADLNARTNFVMPDGGVAQPSSGVAATSPASTFPTTNLATSSGPRVFQGGAPISPYGRVTDDRLTPETFYTYHIVFVPDMTHKYGLKIKGGVGEIRAAMNLVNGWQFTGLGPYYMKDSSTAQDTLASGITANLAASGVANVIRSIASLPKTGVAAPAAPPSRAPEQLPAGATEALDILAKLDLKPITLNGYAEISVFEAYISPEGTMEWRPLAGLERMSFDRHVLGAITRSNCPAAAQQPAKPAAAPGGSFQNEGVPQAPAIPTSLMVPPPASTAEETAMENAILGRSLGLQPAGDGGGIAFQASPAAAPAGFAPAQNRGLLPLASRAAGPASVPFPAPGSMPVGIIPPQIDLSAPQKTSRLGLPRLSNFLHHKQAPRTDATQVVSAPTVVPVAPVNVAPVNVAPVPPPIPPPPARAPVAGSGQ